MHREDGELYSRFASEYSLAGGETLQDAETLKKKAKFKTLKWFSMALLGILVVAIIAVVVLYAAPVVLEKFIVPLLEWESQNLSKPVEALISFVCLSVFPSVFLPIGPTMWLIGITFGYFYGFLLIYSGVFFGISLPYFIGHWLFHERVQSWKRTNPKQSILLTMAENGDFFHQFKVVALLRVSPFPFPIFNYAVTATKISYLAYISASMLAIIPETLMAIYFGRVLKQLFEMHKRSRRKLTPVEIASEVTGLILATLVMVIVMIYGQKELKKLQEKEEEIEVIDRQREIEFLDIENGVGKMASRSKPESLVRSLSWSEGLNSSGLKLPRKDVWRMLSSGGAETKESKDRRRKEMRGRTSEDGSLFSKYLASKESFSSARNLEDTRMRRLEKSNGNTEMEDNMEGGWKTRIHDQRDRAFSLSYLKKKLLGIENQPLLQSHGGGDGL